MKNELSINLLRTQSTLTQEELFLLTKIRTGAVIITLIILGLGFFVGMSFLAAKLRFDSLSKQRDEATKRLTIAAPKEAMLLALKSRLILVNKGLRSEYPWESILNSVAQIVTPPHLHTITVDAQNLITLDISSSSLEDIQDIVNKTSDLARQNKLKNPHIQSLTSQNSGEIDGSIQFTPVF